MNVKHLRNFALTHFLANVILAIMSYILMFRSGFEIKELLSWVYILGIYGLLATFLSKKKIQEFLISFILLIPIVIPIMFAGMNGMLPGELILFDAFGVGYINFKINEYEKNLNKENGEMEE